MTSLVPISETKSNFNTHHPLLSQPSGTLAGRTVVPTDDPLSIIPSAQPQKPIQRIVPSLKDTHPDIQIRELPKSLREAVSGLNALEITLCEAFFAITTSNLFALEKLFRSEDFENLHLRFSFILSLIRTVNTIDLMDDTPENTPILATRQEIAYIFPQLTKNLCDNWKQQQQQQLVPATTRMGAGNRKSALEVIEEVDESFQYLQRLSSDTGCQFEVFGTATIHVNQSGEDYHHSVEDFLSLILKVHHTMQCSFVSHSILWTNTLEPGDDKSCYEITDLTKKLINSRIKKKNFSSSSLFGLYESLIPFNEKFGKMHINALSNDALEKHLCFYPKLFQVLASEIDMTNGNDARIISLTSTIYPAYIKLHKQYIALSESFHCSALSQAMRVRGVAIDRKAIETIIRESREIIGFFAEFKDDCTKWSTYTNGLVIISFSEIILHVEDTIQLIEELQSSSEEHLEASLYAIFDLKVSICTTLMQGVNAKLNSLNASLTILKLAQLSGAATDQEYIESILNHIKTIVQITAMLSEKSPVINKLAQKICGELPQQPRKIPSNIPKGKKPSGKKVAKRKKVRRTASAKSKAEPKMSSRDLKLESTDVDEVIDLPVDKPEIAFLDPEDVGTIEEITEELLSTTMAFQKSIDEDHRDQSKSDEALSARNVKWSVLCDELQKAGFKLLRTKGSHRHYQHPDATEVGLATVPIHSGTVSLGVVKNIREQIDRALDSHEN